MPRFPPQDPAGAPAVPDQGVKSAEYELAEQDAFGLVGEEARPDRRRVRGNPPTDEEDVRRGREKLDRVIAK